MTPWFLFGMLQLHRHFPSCDVLSEMDQSRAIQFVKITALVLSPSLQGRRGGGA